MTLRAVSICCYCTYCSSALPPFLPHTPATVTDTVTPTRRSSPWHNAPTVCVRSPPSSTVTTTLNREQSNGSDETTRFGRNEQPFAQSEHPHLPRFACCVVFVHQKTTNKRRACLLPWKPGVRFVRCWLTLVRPLSRIRRTDPHRLFHQNTAITVDAPFNNLKYDMPHTTRQQLLPVEVHDTLSLRGIYLARRTFCSPRTQDQKHRCHPTTLDKISCSKHEQPRR